MGFASLSLVACSGSDSNTQHPASGGGAGASGSSGSGGAIASGGSGGVAAGGSNSGGAGHGGTASMSRGWLYTVGNKIMVSNGTSGTQWMGRGVNIDDIYFCGWNYTLSQPSPEKKLETESASLIANWKPNFIRISLGMASSTTVSSWLTDDAKYKTPMIAVINSLTANPNVYVLVTLRSDASMIGQDMGDGDPEATGIPSDSSTTPDKMKFPNGTDPVYTGLVDAFAQNGSVLFGITNEPGGKTATDDTIAAAMSHAVSVIRAEEDKLGVPHHLVSVQGNGWTSQIGFYDKKPLTQDNVVYEVHGYPPMSSGYTFANIPVIIGEYGTLDATSAPPFFADLETKQISNLAWDFDAFSDCAPDLVSVTHDETKLNATDWGKLVQAYLTKHAQ